MVEQLSDGSKEKPIILFDGVCNLCNGFIQFVIRRDREGVFRFGSLQSDDARKLLQRSGLNSDVLNTIVLIEENTTYTRSTAVLRIAKQLNGLWKLCAAFSIIPKLLRDIVYDFIAKNRYRWFGKRDICMAPSPELRQRFIDGQDGKVTAH